MDAKQQLTVALTREMSPSGNPARQQVEALKRA